MKGLYFILITIFINFSGCLLVRAQTDPSPFRFEHITVNEGLSHSDAMAVVQDQQGFIWIATNKGVNRYDGYEIKHYLLPIDNENGLSNNRVRTLHVSAQGILWAGTEGGGLNVYNPNQDRFVRLQASRLPLASRQLLHRLTESEITALISDRQGGIWVGTKRHGLFIVKSSEYGQVQGISPVDLGTTGSQPSEITDLTIDQAGHVWIATYNDGLFVANSFQPGARATLANPFSDRHILALALDHADGMWIGTDTHVLWVKGDSLRTSHLTKPYVLPQTFQSIGCLHKDSFGRLWVGTDFGLSMLPVELSAGHPPIITDKMTTYLPMDADPNSINSGRVHCIFEDRFQVLWLAASAGGLNKIDLRQKPFGHLSRKFSEYPTLANNYINALYKENDKGLLWITTRNGISSYDLKTNKYRNYFDRQLPGNVTGMDVSCIFQDSNGTLWFSARYDGLISIRRQGGREIVKTYPHHDGLFHFVESITEDKFGTLWLASFDYGLTRMSRDGQVLARYTTRNSPLRSDRFTFLLYDKDENVLWASTQDAGVLKLRVLPDRLELLRQFKHDTRNPTSLRVNYAWPLLKDRLGTIWVGTIGGGLHQIVRTKTGQEEIRSCTAWLPDSDVESILEDNQGNLWLGSEGLIRINPATHQVIRYNVVDGVQSNSFKVGAACRANDETLYFGGINGITYLQPRAIQANPYPPFVRITSLSIANQPIGVGQAVNNRVLIQKPLNKAQTLRIKAAENDFSISFVGLNFANPKKHRYAYQLVGYNDNWIQLAPGQRTASFANLPAGNYTFQVKAENGEGQWTHQPATLRLTILPPWWRTWWAYSLYTLLIGGALLLARRVLLQQQALKNKIAFEHFQYEKEKELSDLKLEFFTNVSHELRTPLTLILGPMEELAASAWKFNGMKDKVLLVHQQTRRLLSLINQLLDFRKMESQHIPLQAVKSDAVSFLVELFLMFKLKAEEQQIRYTIDTLPEAVMLYFDRSKLEVAVINVLSNALKYTSAGRGVHLSVRVVGSADQPARFQQQKLLANYLEITVRDEGVGIKPEELSRIFDLYYQASHTANMRVVGTGIGLSLVKQFIERHGGEVELSSRVGEGTTFIIRLPLGKDHLATSDLALDTPGSALPAHHEPFIDDITATTLTDLTPATLRLLVVEDNSDVRQYINHLFAAKFEVFTAVDGIDGWEQALQLMPDVIISDIMMPRSDGLDLCKKIKQHPKTLHIPVVLLTARVAVVHEIEGLETGADEYISKPFNPDLLIAKVNTLVHNRLKLRQYYQQKILLEPTEVLIPDADKVFLETAMNIVEKNLTEPEFSVLELVKEMAMSRSVFYRRIKSITGQSVVEFINDVRMKRAAQLLSSSQLRISEVCVLVGLEDVKYFRKSFQQVHGLSPSEYARKHRAEREVQEEVF